MMPDISCNKAKELIQDGAQLVDVRSQLEYMQGALPGAVNLPLQVIQGAHDQLDNSKPIILYCVSGARSGKAKMMLEAMGYHSVFNLGSFRNYFC